MSGVDTREDLVPLRTDFDRSWRGYDTRQVRVYVQRVEADLRLVISDRDAAAVNAEDLAKQLEELRCENDRLRAKVDRVSREPIEADGLSERLLRMVELAEDEATEITERARVAAERSWAAAEHVAQRLRERHEQLVAEVDVRRKQAAAEHDELMRRAREEAELLTSQAAQSRRKLDEQAARRRARVERDFEEAMNVRRGNALHVVAEQERESREQAERLVSDARAKSAGMIAEATERSERMVADATAEADRLVREATAESARLVEEATAKSAELVGEATAEAARLVAEAQGKVDVLEELRKRMSGQLHATQKLLAEAAPLLLDASLHQGTDIVPGPRAEPTDSTAPEHDAQVEAKEPVKAG